jgi:hypothetical protein
MRQPSKNHMPDAKRRLHMTPSRVAFYNVLVSCVCAILLFPVASPGEPPSPGTHPTRKMSNAEVRQALDRELPKTEFDHDLASVIDFMRDVTGVTFDVQWDKLKAAGITEKTRVTVKLGNAKMREILTAILTSAGGKPGVVGYTVEKGTIVIGPAKPPTTKPK